MSLVARIWPVLLLAASACSAQRVLLVSLDGFGYQALMMDDATRGMTALRGLIGRGVARPMQPAFPSTTANGHIALATGAWGDVNGKHANSHAVLPRAGHSSFERENGFRAEGLAAEPVWVTAARQGVPSAAVNFVPTYPFLPVNAPEGLPVTVINNYQTRRIAPNRLLTERDMQAVPCAGNAHGRCFAWREGTLTFHARLRTSPSGGYEQMELSTADGSASVSAWAAPLESEPPLGRPLARHFSEGLALSAPVEAVVYFRLFELAADGSSFTLLRTAVQELGVHAADGAEMRRRILAGAGGVLDNGTALGSPADDIGLRRTMELDELVIRQQGRLQEWVWRNGGVRLQLGYFSYPDHSDHAWLGLAAGDPRLADARAWIYTALDAALAPVIESMGPADHIFFVSDHGMAPVHSHFRAYLPLERAGLVARDANGKLDPARSKVSILYNCLLVNTRDWRGGIVPAGERETVLATARRVLGAVRDPESGEAVIHGFYSTPEEKAALGFGGEGGADLCLDPAPGYYLNMSFDGPVIQTLETPTGQHGGYPLSADMRSIFIGAGPRLRIPAAAARVRAIDVAPLLTDLLNIAPPAQARGRSPIQSQ